MLTSGSDVVDDSMLGRRCRLSGWSACIVVYMSLILCWLMKCRSRDRALVGDRVSRKYWHRSVRGSVGGHAMEAMLGRRLWNRCRMVESGFVLMSNNSPIVWGSRRRGRSLWVRMPVMAFRLVLLMLRTKSGIARELASRQPRPPLVVASCAIWREWVGRVVLYSLERKLVIIRFVARTRGPSQWIKGWSASLMSRWYNTSVSKRCGSFWRVQSTKILYLVWGSCMALWIVSVCCCISSSFSLMKLMANSGEPTGVPRSRNPESNSTGIGFCGSSMFALLE